MSMRLCIVPRWSAVQQFDEEERYGPPAAVSSRGRVQPAPSDTLETRSFASSLEVVGMTKLEIQRTIDLDEQAAREHDEICAALRAQSLRLQEDAPRLSRVLLVRSAAAERMAQIHRYAAHELRQVVEALP